MNMMTDIPAAEISDFVNLLKKELPYSLFIINFIETCHKWIQINNQLQISLLCAENSMETGVFVGVVKSGCRGIVISCYAFDGYEKDLEQAVKQVLVKWKNIRYLGFEAVVEKHVAIVEKLMSDQNYEFFSVPLIMLSLSVEDALKINIPHSDEVELLPLSERHAEEMYEVWVKKRYLSVDSLKNDIRYNSEAAYGVFCKKSGELLTRCVRSHCGVLAALQTVEKARNKGYAKLLLKYISKKIAEKDILPCTYVADFNQASLNTFLSCGYKEACKLKDYWAEK